MLIMQETFHLYSDVRSFLLNNCPQIANKGDIIKFNAKLKGFTIPSALYYSALSNYFKLLVINIFI